MNKYLTLIVLCLGSLSAALVNSCKKDSASSGSTLTEEFQMVFTINEKGWVIQDNTGDTTGSSSSGWGASAAWTQGMSGTDKGGAPYGFPAYSYKSSTNEYAYSYFNGPTDSSCDVSSWLITPVLAVKNGDRLSFYTRGDNLPVGSTTSRLQVLMNHSGSADVGITRSSVGDFTTSLFDINADQRAGGYPTGWTKYEYTFTGVEQKTSVRIAFRYYLNHAQNPGGVALDLFQFHSN